MAEGGRRSILTHSQLNAGDEYFDLTCSRCSKKKKNKQSVKYCVACKQYFCGDCLEVHEDFFSSAGHVLVDTDSRVLSLRRTGRDIKMVPTELCKEHPTEVVNMYCEDDDSVGCHICFALHHRACNVLHYIPKYIQDYNLTPLIDRISKKFSKTIKHIKTLETDSEVRISECEKCKVDCKKEIDQYRKEINDAIDKIEEQTLGELDTQYNNYKQFINNYNLEIQEMKSDLKHFQNDIASDQVNMAQKFVLTVLGQSLIKRCGELKSRLKENQMPKLHFSRNTNILASLLNVLTLGLISSTGNQDTVEASSRYKQTSKPASTVTTTTSGATGSRIGSGNVREATRRSEKHSLYRVVNTSKYNIKQHADKHSCDIWSSCITDGHIIIVDVYNRKLKLVDSETYNIKSSFSFKATPLSVCEAENGNIVVCLDNNTVQFISTSDQIVPTRSLRMKHCCRCIAFSNDELFICTGGELHIYTVLGKLLKSFNFIKSGTKRFSNISDVTVSDDHSLIHIVDLDSGVITLDMNGKICWEFSGEVLSAPMGVCTDGSGNVFVCGRDSDNIIMLGHDGEFLGEIVTKQDKQKGRQQSVCYDKNRNTLIVSGLDDCIQAFSLQL